MNWGDRVLKIYFGGFKTGRINRVPYLSYSILLGAILLVFILASVLAIVGVEKLIGGDLAITQQLVAKYLGLPFIISLAILSITLFIAGLNITAKRARDIGLPGWVFVVGCIAVSLLIFRYISQDASLIFSAIILIGLLLAPGSIFNRQQE